MNKVTRWHWTRLGTHSLLTEHAKTPTGMKSLSCTGTVRNGSTLNLIGQAGPVHARSHLRSLATNETNLGFLGLLRGTDSRQRLHVAHWVSGQWVEAGGQVVKAESRTIRPLGLLIRRSGTVLVSWSDGLLTRLRELRDGKWQFLPPVTTGSEVTSDSVIEWRGALLIGWSEPDQTQIEHISVMQDSVQGWQWLFRRMQRDPELSDARLARFVEAGEDLFVTWDEPSQGGQSLQVIKIRECAPREKPRPAARTLRRRRDFWPKSVEEASEQVLVNMSEESKALVRTTPKKDLIQFHFGWGTGIRNGYGLWGHDNKALLEACGNVHPEDCSMKIIEQVWERLQVPKLDAGD
jgi:hypothetical protein